MKKLLISCIILFLTTSCFAVEETTKSFPQGKLMYFLGLDTKSSPTAVQDGRATDIQNIKLDLTYGATKRHGYSVVNNILDTKPNGLTAMTGLYHSRLSDGIDYITSVCGSRIYYDNSGTWTDITSAAVVASGITVSQDNQYVWTTALDSIIGTNGVDPPFKSSGTSTSILDVSDLSVSNSFTAKCVAWFKNYLILGNTIELGTARVTRGRWSKVGTIETFDDDDYIDIDALGGQELEGFGILYDNLYAFFSSSIYKISLVGGDEIFHIAKVVDGIGSISKNSIQTITLKNAQQGIIFLDKNKKVYFFNGTSVEYISSLIEGTMNDLNASRLQYAVSADTGTSYYLCASSGASTTNNTLLEFQYEIGEWTKHTDIDANVMARIRDSSNNLYTYFGNYKNFVYQLDDDTLNSDVLGTSGSVDIYESFSNSLTSGTNIIYDASAAFTSSGQTVKITSGTGSGEEKVVVGFTVSGLIVDSAFSATLDTTSVYTTGIIDAVYQSKWFDLGDASRRKHFTNLYVFAEEESGTDLEVSYASDFKSTLATETFDLSGSGAVWGTAVWGVSLWGGQDAVFKRATLKTSGRFIKLKFQDNEIDEPFKLYGYSLIYEDLDIQ